MPRVLVYSRRQYRAYRYYSVRPPYRGVTWYTFEHNTRDTGLLSLSVSILRMLPITLVRLGKKGIPVPNTPVCSGLTQHRYLTLRYVWYHLNADNRYLILWVRSVRPPKPTPVPEHPRPQCRGCRTSCGERRTHFDVIIWRLWRRRKTPQIPQSSAYQRTACFVFLFNAASFHTTRNIVRGA